MFDAHFDRQSSPDFAVVDTKRTHFRPPVRDRHVPRTVMPHQQHVVRKVHRVILGERAAGPQRVEQLHRLDVLDLVLAGDRHAAAGEQRGGEDDRAHHILVLGDPRAFVVVGQRAEIVLGDEPVEGNGRTCGALHLFRGTVLLNVEHLVESRHAFGNRRTAGPPGAVPPAPRPRRSPCARQRWRNGG